MKYLILFLALFLLGCHNNTALNPQNKAQTLSAFIYNIDKKIEKTEADDLAKQVYEYALVLKQDYELVSPPLLHNLLVNMGVKKRGLCWQFAYDLLSHLKAQKYKSFDYYIVGANINEYWQEHNALLVTCQGCSFTKGVIIDLWRNSAQPFYVKFGFDNEYEWSLRGGKR